LAGACALLDVLCELLLLLFELCAFAVELSLRLLECALVLPQPLGWRLCAAEERVDDVHVEADRGLEWRGRRMSAGCELWSDGRCVSARVRRWRVDEEQQRWMQR
jgi:hypothetical protein